jgi:hypothetical protein
MLVVPRSPLFAFDRQASRREERLVVAGQYSKKLYSDREKYGTAQCYEVLLLDANNQPLHEIGLAYVAKGANQASFSFHWQQLVDRVTKCHAIANSIPARAKDARFNSLCVFEFTVKRELAGNNAKSPACKVHNHVEPTQENWEQFFLGREDEVADRFLDLLVPTTALILPQAVDAIDGEIVAEVASLEALLDLAEVKNITPLSLENLFQQWFGCAMNEAGQSDVATAIERVRTM